MLNTPDKFEQCLPDAETILYILITKEPKKAHRIKYRNANTNEVYSVPNIWYNQPIECGIEYYLGMSKIYEQNAISLSRTPAFRAEAEKYYEQSQKYYAIYLKSKEQQEQGFKFRQI